MPKTQSPAAGEAMPAGKINRRKLIKGTAIAATTTMVGSAAAAEIPANSKLPELIDAHKAAHSALDKSVDVLVEATERFEAGKTSRLVKMWRAGHCQLSGEGKGVQSWWETRNEAREYFKTQLKKDQFAVPRYFSDDVFNAAMADIKAAYRAASRRLSKAIKELRIEQEAFGYPQALQAHKEADDAEMAATMDLVAYRCETVAECRLKADYIKSCPNLLDSVSMDPECFEAFFSSFLSVEA